MSASAVMRSPYNTCQFGHARHKTKRVGGLVIFDWEEYQGLAGYCSGQDQVSMTIDLTGSWEVEETAKAMSVVEAGDMVFDFGAHIGWYAHHAALLGAHVYAYEADWENVRLLRQNCPRLLVKVGWIEDMPPVTTLFPVRLVKIDVEGAEIEAVRIIRPLLDAGLVDSLLVECSPEFDSYYPELIDMLIGYGYTATVVGKAGERPVAGATLGPVQQNVWFTR